jgi:Uma2 family endonuclease
MSMTAAEFLAWDAPDDSERWELIDGEPVAMEPNTPRHGAIAAEAIRLIANHLEGHPRCRVISEGTISPDEHNVRIPDLTVSCERLGLDDMLREPLLIVEITARAASIEADVARYRTMPSAQEILLLRCMEIGATLHRRAPDAPWKAAEPLRRRGHDAGQHRSHHAAGRVLPDSRMMTRIVATLLSCTIAGALLAGCAANTRASDQALAVHGYWFHDANHQSGGGAQASPQAVANAIQGTWLWPPASTVRAQ